MQNLANDVLAARHLALAEARLRTAARLIELIPGHAEDAAPLFDMASRLRAERLDLLNRYGLAS